MGHIDCLFVGHNKVPTQDNIRMIQNMGKGSGAFMDISHSYFENNSINYDFERYVNTYILNQSVNEGNLTLRSDDTFCLSIAYLASFLNNRNYSIDYINSFDKEKDLLKEKLLNNEIVCVAITTTYYVTAFPIIQIIEFIRSIKPDIKIVLGGPYVSTQLRTESLPDVKQIFGNLLKADYYINNSQGEQALVNLISCIKDNRDPIDVYNLLYFKGKELIYNKHIREDNKLYNNPVCWDLFAEDLSSQINVRTAISCPFSCSFCGFPEHAGKYQVNDIFHVEQELDCISKLNKVKHIFFTDDTFNIPVKRFKDILKTMIRKKYDFTWHSYFRCQFADEEMVELMKESGCKGVFLGIESGSDIILKNMNKKTTTEKYYNGIKLLKKYGITTFGSFLVGFPGETYNTVNTTIEFIRNSGLDFYRSQLWFYEKISPINQQKDKYGIKGNGFEWEHNTMDYKQAKGLIDEMFVNINDPIWIPQYNFDFHGFWDLYLKGVSLEDIRLYLKAFHLATIYNISFGNVPNDIFDQICNPKNGIELNIKEGVVNSQSNEMFPEFDF